jgi:hypothetical protein
VGMPHIYTWPIYCILRIRLMVGVFRLEIEGVGVV